MKSLVGTQTAKNLMNSFANECQTYTRYTFYCQAAKTQGYIQIANIFLETADNEKAHALGFLHFLKADFNDTMPRFNISSPFSLHEKTDCNLEGAVFIENELWTEIYPGFAKVARTEGFPEIANAFERVAVAEKMHDKRFSVLMNNLKDGAIFLRNEAVSWKCNNCGYIHRGKRAPEKCPFCLHPKGYFEVFCGIC